MNNNFRLIELLKRHPNLTADDIADELDITRADAYNLIHTINRTAKYTRNNVKIVRGGKYGQSTYSLVSNNTVPGLILKNVNRHMRSLVEHLKRQRELGIIGEQTLQYRQAVDELKAGLIAANKELNDALLEITYGSLNVLTARNVGKNKKKTIAKLP